MLTKSSFRNNVCGKIKKILFLGGNMGKHFSFVHCADLHLGEPFEGLRSGVVGPWTEAIGKATFKAFERVVDIALEKRANAILISGDIYNSNHHSLAAQMAFGRELYRAAQAGIQVFIVHGNHDAEDAWKADIPLPESVHVFASDKVSSVPLLINGEKVATIYGISYKTMHNKENVAKEFHKQADDVFAIGMLHTEVGNAESPYAPCTIDDLVSSGIDYWALGHVHTKQIVKEKPYIVYPGNTQGLSSREQGARGCYFVDVGAFGTVNMEFIDTDAIRWMDMTIDISSIKNQEELIGLVLKERASFKELTESPDIIRLILIGRGPLHKIISSEEGREYILQAINAKEQFRYIFAYFSQIIDRTKPVLDLEERRKLPDILADYLHSYDAVAKLPDIEKIKVLKEVLAETAEFKKMPELMNYISEEMIKESFSGAENEGAERISLEDIDENY